MIKLSGVKISFSWSLKVNHATNIFNLEGLMNALEDEQEVEIDNIADLNKMFENYRMNDENLEENRTDAMSEVFHL